MFLPNILIIFDFVLNTLARQSPNKFGFALDLFVFLWNSATAWKFGGCNGKDSVFWQTTMLWSRL